MTVKSKLTVTALLLAVLAALAIGFFLWRGIYNVSALTPHTWLVYNTLEYARIKSVKVRSPEQVPDLDALDWRDSGLRIYQRECTQCHGAPGVAPEPFSLGMMPPPSAIVRVARQRSAGELYWVIANGIKMSGMPAWSYRLSDRELWQLVALLKRLPLMTAAEYQNLRAQANAQTPSTGKGAAIPDPGEPYPKAFDNDGRVALQQYNCPSCHVIPGMPSADYYVGPPLGDIVQRSFIAGVLPMSRENLINWIRDPSQYKTKTTMPDLGVTRAHAERMVDYFESLVDQAYPQEP